MLGIKTILTEMKTVYGGLFSKIRHAEERRSVLEDVAIVSGVRESKDNED